MHNLLVLCCFVVVVAMAQQQLQPTFVAKMYTFAGGGYGDQGQAIFASTIPTRVAIDDVNQLLYFSDTLLHRVRVINLKTNIVSLFAGTGVPGYSGDGRAATSAQLNNPQGILVDTSNNVVYIADSGNFKVKKFKINTN